MDGENYRVTCVAHGRRKIQNIERSSYFRCMANVAQCNVGLKYIYGYNFDAVDGSKQKKCSPGSLCGPTMLPYSASKMLT